jgi:hypothetical protein
MPHKPLEDWQRMPGTFPGERPFTRRIINDQRKRSDAKSKRDLWIRPDTEPSLLNRFIDIGQTVLETSAGLATVAVQTGQEFISEHRSEIGRLYGVPIPKRPKPLEDWQRMPGILPGERPVTQLGEGGEIKRKFDVSKGGWTDIGGRARRAYQTSDLPSFTVSLPGKGIRLPFGKRLDDIKIGTKGLIEIAADPLNLFPFGAGLAKGIRMLGRGAVGGTAAVGGKAATTAAVGGAAATAALSGAATTTTAAASKRIARNAVILQQQIVEQVAQQKTIKDTLVEAGLDVDPDSTQAIQDLTAFIHSNESFDLAELTVKMRNTQQSQRFADLEIKTEELIRTGLDAETAMTQARHQVMSGEYDRPLAVVSESMATTFRDAAFKRVYIVLKDEPSERLATLTALTRALQGKGIPRRPGSKGGSAYSRLSRVFPPEMLTTIGKNQPIEGVLDDLLGRIDLKKPVSKVSGRPKPKGVSPRTLREVEPGQLDAEPIPKPDTPKPDTPRGDPLDIVADPSKPVQYDDTSFWEGAQGELIPRPKQKWIQRALKEIGLTTLDIAEFVRANKASFDFSWWRQQSALIINNKRDFFEANLVAWKASWSSKYAATAERRILKHKYIEYYMAEKYDFLRPLVQKDMPKWQRAEPFMVLGGDRPIPKFAGKLPWITWSQRAYVTGTNEMNWRMFERYVKKMEKLEGSLGRSGRKIPTNWKGIRGETADFAAMLTDMTGRGRLHGRVLGQDLDARSFSPILNAGLFAVRNTLGNMFSPRHLFSANPRVRSEAARNMVTYVSTVGGITFAGEQMGLWHVEKDMNNSDYGKLRIGPHRFDPWFGRQKYAVLLSRLATKKGVSPLTRKEYDTDRGDILLRFIRGLGAPGPSIVGEITTGETFLGEEVDLKSWQQWMNRLAPMTLDSIAEAIEEGGPAGGLVGGPSFFGVGVGSYPYKIADMNRKWERTVSDFLLIPGDDGEAKERDMPTRAEYRRKNPQADAKLFIMDYGSSLASQKAKRAAIQMMKDNKIGVNDIKNLDEQPFSDDYGLPQQKLRQDFLAALGEEDVRPEDETQGAIWDFNKKVQDTGYDDILFNIPLYRDSPNAAEAYDRYRFLSGQGIAEKYMDLTNTAMARAKRIKEWVTEKRKELRKNNPVLDAGLIKYGDSNSSNTTSGDRALRIKRADILEEQGAS